MTDTIGAFPADKLKRVNRAARYTVRWGSPPPQYGGRSSIAHTKSITAIRLSDWYSVAFGAVLVVSRTMTDLRNEFCLTEVPHVVLVYTALMNAFHITLCKSYR